jgi:HAE1 family hydrophobic/amphiphilic exporter-1
MKFSTFALTTASGERVALRNVVTSESSRGPILIDRKDQQRRVTVTRQLAGRDLGSVARGAGTARSDSRAPSAMI